MPETNIINASAPVTLMGKQYHLRYLAHAFITYAEECKSDLLRDIRQFEGMQINSDTFDSAKLFSKTRDVLWAGLIDEQPELTRAQVARLFGFGDLMAVMQAVTEAIWLTVPKADRPTLPPNVRAIGGSQLINGLESGAGFGTVAESPRPSSDA